MVYAFRSGTNGKPLCFFFYFPFAAFLDFQFPVPFRILGVRSSPSQVTDIWEFPKIRGTLFGGPCYKDITI